VLTVTVVGIKEVSQHIINLKFISKLTFNLVMPESGTEGYEGFNFNALIMLACKEFNCGKKFEIIADEDGDEFLVIKNKEELRELFEMVTEFCRKKGCF